ncbi:hypothetical protein GPB2148_1951 [marine gamma proteobacterium HTCC2148]|nr:hypothetical protein GPB2148_1951 [marine gamma proteobacterium HTCC2148]
MAMLARSDMFRQLLKKARIGLMRPNWPDSRPTDGLRPANSP